jgi:Ca-activated chloride channel family protein
MELATPAALPLLVLAIPIAYVGFRRRPGAIAVAATQGIAAAPATLRLRAARLLPALRVLALVALVGALAGPRIGDANAVVPAQGIDIGLTLDISSSMNASFGNSTRIEATKQVVRDFIKGRQNDRIGLVVFQEDALPLSPPTLDYGALDAVVASVKTGLLSDGTGIGVGLGATLNMLRDSTAASRIVILLTDGQQNARSISPQDAADLAKALGIRVYTIGVIDQSPGARGEVDERLLQQIAQSTGGRYFAAENPDALKDVYQEISTLETSRVGREHFERFTELAPWLAAAAAAFIAVELTLRATWLRRVPA